MDPIINSLPDEIKMQIFSNLSIKEVAVVSSVCKLWHGLAKDDQLWKGFAKSLRPDIKFDQNLKLKDVVIQEVGMKRHARKIESIAKKLNIALPEAYEKLKNGTATMEDFRQCKEWERSHEGRLSLCTASRFVPIKKPANAQ